jgi:uncharacterized membrane protein HdeD (DUF308 family)
VTIDQRHKNSIYSIILFVVLCLIVLAINWDTDFAAAGIIFITTGVGIAVGLIFIILKLFKVTVSKTNFIYNYFGILNLILGLLTCFIPGIILLTLTQLFIGLFILYDIFKRQEHDIEF